ncbi:hypothetical protein AB0K16_16825 [Nonomuraea jabiensis]|uniref:hypothetical protein n=1 Tax=Nonomuraea jabiensis TaxID=882448 RepID=UPI003421E231
MDRYPDDVFAEIRDLYKRVEQLEAQLGQRAPLTTASQGWLLADMTIPSVPAEHVQIGSNGEDLFVARPSGSVKGFLLRAPASP